MSFHNAYSSYLIALAAEQDAAGPVRGNTDSEGELNIMNIILRNIGRFRAIFSHTIRSPFYHRPPSPSYHQLYPNYKQL